MRTIRKHVFETNSSSCHSITICGEKMLKAYKAGLVACIHPFHFYSDDGYAKTVVPDKDFWTLAAIVSYIKEKWDSITIPNGYEDEAKFLQTSLTEESIKTILSDPYGNTGDVDHYEVISLLEKFFEGNDIFYGTEGETNPFATGDDDEEDNYEGIEGPIVTIDTEVSC